jgi:periplasmic protein CpxP/Spy
MRSRLTLTAWLAALVLAAGGAGAQQRPAQRAALEQRFRERVGQLVQQRLQLTNDQATKLRATNQRFEARRLELLREERATRQALRRQLAGGGASADQREVGRLLDAMLAIHRRRLEIAEAEQRELAGYLTPVQRAKYFALQDEVRRRMQEMQRRRAGAQR